MNDKIHKALDTLTSVTAGIDTIQQITKLGGVGADAALTGIRAVLAIVSDAASHPAGAVTSAVVADELAKLVAGLRGNDAIADSALDQKFGH